MKMFFAVGMLVLFPTLGFGASLSSRSFAGPSTLTNAAPTFTLPAVDNPSAVTFTPSADHATIDGYELDIIRPDGSVLQTLNIGKPVPDANGICTASLNVQPVAFGVGYWVQLRAKAGTAFSVNTVSENAFNRIPGGPTKITVK